MLDILLRIWGADKGFVFLPYREGSVWVEPPAVDLDHPDFGHFTETGDRYFAPLVFDAPVRNNENVSQAHVLFADIDTGSTDLITPTILWQTSPDSYQGVWFLRESVPIGQFNDLNRRLTYTIRADRGGWHASKVLRIPQTLNWKRAQYTDSELRVPRGILIHDDGPSYSVDELLPRLDYSFTYTPREVVSSPPPATPTTHEWTSLYMAKRDSMPLSVRSWLLQRSTSDRSSMIWRTACALAMNALTPEDTFKLLSLVGWNKWKEQPHKLWRDVQKAYAFVNYTIPYENPDHVGDSPK